MGIFPRCPSSRRKSRPSLSGPNSRLCAISYRCCANCWVCCDWIKGLESWTGATAIDAEETGHEGPAPVLGEVILLGVDALRFAEFGRLGGG